ncbi:hypothetical protein FB446DRAFT_825072 [Lentinula raphanica]|nr:hypothetical protein FB446DRAFT_825072 [Lentinula raphanica]
MSVIEDVRLDCESDSTPRARFFRLIFDLLIVSSHAVKYEAATTLTLLTQNPAAVKAYCVDRFGSLRSKPEHILDGLVTHVSLNSWKFLKKQLLRTQEKAAEFDKASEYRQLLIQSIHVTAIKFSEVAASVVLALMEFLGDSVGASSNSNAVTTSTALDVIAFIREVWEVFRGVLWILGEFVGAQDSYSSTNEAAEAIKQCIEGIRTCLGDIPIYVDSAQETKLDDVTIHKEAGGGKPKVLADGTYATETAYNATTSSESQIGKARPPLRIDTPFDTPRYLPFRSALILGGDFFTGTVLAVTLTKLVRRFEVLCPQQSLTNALRAQAMLIMTSIICVGHVKSSPAPGAPVVQIDEDSTERIMNCIQTLSNFTGQTKVDTDDDEAIVKEIFLRDTERAFERMIGAQEKRAAESAFKGSTIQVDDLLSFRQGSSQRKLISQLTGFSDPLHVETVSLASPKRKGERVRKNEYSPSRRPRLPVIIHYREDHPKILATLLKLLPSRKKRLHKRLFLPDPIDFTVQNPLQLHPPAALFDPIDHRANFFSSSSFTSSSPSSYEFGSSDALPIPNLVPISHLRQWAGDPIENYGPFTPLEAPAQCLLLTGLVIFTLSSMVASGKLAWRVTSRDERPNGIGNALTRNEDGCILYGWRGEGELLVCIDRPREFCHHCWKTHSEKFVFPANRSFAWKKIIRPRLLKAARA